MENIGDIANYYDNVIDGGYEDEDENENNIILINSDSSSSTSSSESLDESNIAVNEFMTYQIYKDNLI